MEQIQITVDTSASLEEETVLEVKELCVTRSGKLVLEDINLEIKSGEFVGLVGPNGSGKSTLMLSILGILKAQKGSVRIYGSPPMSRNQIGKIGWVSQAAANLKKEIRITVEELVKLGTVNAKNMFFRSRKEQYSAVENAIQNGRNGRASNKLTYRNYQGAKGSGLLLLGHWHQMQISSFLMSHWWESIEMQEIHC